LLLPPENLTYKQHNFGMLQYDSDLRNDFLTGRATCQTLRSNVRTGSRSRLLTVGGQDSK